jgi:hypothetical protein
MDTRHAKAASVPASQDDTSGLWGETRNGHNNAGPLLLASGSVPRCPAVLAGFVIFTLPFRYMPVKLGLIGPGVPFPPSTCPKGSRATHTYE